MSDQDQAQNETQNGEDISNGEDTYVHPETISSPKRTENHAQNLKGEDSEDSEGIFGTGAKTAKWLKEYERLSALARKSSKAAEKQLPRPSKEEFHKP